MAAEVQQGTAVVHGVTNSGSAITITGYATFLWDSAKATHNFNINDIPDAVGFDATAIATNEHIEIEISFKPSGATRAAAAAVAVFPSPLAPIVLANFKISLFNGTWQYRGGTAIELGTNDPAKVSSLKLRKYADSAQNTSLTGTVISG